MPLPTSLSLERSSRSLREQISFFLVILFALAYKCNDALSTPQFWAEDATVFFSDQFGHAWPQLFSPYAGYLHTLPRLVAWAASWLSPGKAPLIYNAAAIVLCALAIALTCRRLRNYLPPWIVALSFLAVPTSGEIFGTITNAQWFLQFTMAAYCLAPAQEKSSTRASWLRAVGILLISLTGVFSTLLLIVVAGIAAAGWLAKRLSMAPFGGTLSRFIASRDAYAVGPLVVGALVQVCVLVTHPPGEHEVVQPLLPAFKSTFTQIVPIHTFGSDFLTGTTWLLLYAGVLAALLWSRKVDGHARLVVLGFLALAAVECFAPMLRIADLTPMYSLGAADRYFYLMKVVAWWALWLALNNGTKRSRLDATLTTTALIMLVAVTNTQYLRRPSLVDLNWRGHSSVLDQPGTHTIPVNPGWSITVNVSAPTPP
ncbi:hypothetical protein M2299_003157 [Stenotrophomonas sp. 1278]|jgi:hypothetical protein|nr:hypothetical protein [Stenotrophomonas sp. 1278]